MLQQCDEDLEARNDILVPSPLAVNSACGSEHGEGASTSMSEYQYPPDIKYGIEELCPVCGDKVSGYHYGLQTCESCKGFFKRTVQNKKVYSCVDNRTCHIDKSQRKRCPFCRFQKCLSVGMKLEAVRSDRMRGGRNKFGPMYKRDRALKQQAIRQRQQLLAQCQMQVNGAMSGLDLNMDPSVSMQQLGLHPHHPNSGLFNSGLQNMAMDSMPDIKPNLNMLMPSMLSQNAAVDGHHGNNHHSGSHHNPVVSLGGQMNIPGNRPSALHLGNMTNSLNMPMLSHAPPHAHNAATPAGHLTPLKQIPTHSPNSNSDNHSTSSSVSLTMTNPSSQQPPVYMPPSHGNQGNYTPLGPEVNHPLGGGRGHRVEDGDVAPSAGQYSHNLPVPPPMPHPARHMSSPTSQIPLLIKSLQANELNEEEVEQKLAAVAEVQLAMLQQQPEILQDHSKQWLQLACRLTDQYLFLIVEWARAAIFFKEMKVEDQMKLLQNCWSELIVLDFIYKQRHNTSLDIFTLLTGHKIGVDIFSKLGLSEFKDCIRDLIRKFHDMKIDHQEYTCLKFLILLNPDVPGVNNDRHLEQSQEKINAALLEYCTMTGTDLKDKFGQLLLRLPEIRMLSLRIEEYLYYRHTAGDIPEQTLLMELLHAKRK